MADRRRLQRLLGVDVCRVVSARQLLAEKEGDPRPPRRQDADSIAALRRLLTGSR
jgi:hypothetical protein